MEIAYSPRVLISVINQFHYLFFIVQTSKVDKVKVKEKMKKKIIEDAKSLNNIDNTIFKNLMTAACNRLKRNDDERAKTTLLF